MSKERYKNRSDNLDQYITKSNRQTEKMWCYHWTNVWRVVLEMSLLKKNALTFFFQQWLTELITSNTNKRTDKQTSTNLDKLRTFKEHSFSSSKNTWLKQKTKQEWKPFIGLVYFRDFMTWIIITSSFCPNLAMIRIFLVEKCPNSKRGFY